jgi:hypothetical protein
MKMSKHVKDKISFYMDGLLQGRELQEFESHVKTCGECGKALEGTKQAVKQAKKLKDAPLPANFYAKLNMKLDGIDAAKERPGLRWNVFVRNTAIVLTLLIAGVFVYNIKKQTNNFQSVISKDNSQMPQAEVAVSKPAPAEGKVHKKTVSRARVLKEGYKEKSGVETMGNVMEEKKPAAKAYAPAAYLSMAKAKKELKATEQAKMETYDVAAKSAAAVPAGAAVAAAPAEEAAAPAAQEPEVMEAMMSAPAKKMERSAAVEQVQTFVCKNENDRTASGLPEDVKIDFSKQMAVIVRLGARPTAGYSADITGIDYQADAVVVRYKETKPPAGSMTAQVITYPYTYKIIDRSDLPVEFQEEK